MKWPIIFDAMADAWGEGHCRYWGGGGGEGGGEEGGEEGGRGEGEGRGRGRNIMIKILLLKGKTLFLLAQCPLACWRL